VAQQQSSTVGRKKEYLFLTEQERNAIAHYYRRQVNWLAANAFLAFQKDCLQHADFKILDEISNSKELTQHEINKKVKKWITDPSLKKLIHSWNDDYKVRSSKLFSDIIKQSEDPHSTISKQPVTYEELKEIVDVYQATGKVKKKPFQKKRKHEEQNNNEPNKNPRSLGEGEEEFKYNKDASGNGIIKKKLSSTFINEGDGSYVVDTENLEKETVVGKPDLSVRQFLNELMTLSPDEKNEDETKLIVAFKENVHPTELLLILKSMKYLDDMWSKNYIARRENFSMELFEQLQQLIQLKPILFNRKLVDLLSSDTHCRTGNIKFTISLYRCIYKLLNQTNADYDDDSLKLLLEDDVSFFEKHLNANNVLDGKVCVCGRYWCKTILNDCFTLLKYAVFSFRNNTFSFEGNGKYDTDEPEYTEVHLNSAHFELLCYRHCVKVPGGVFISAETVVEENASRVGFAMKAILGESALTDLFDIHSLENIFISSGSQKTPAIIFDESSGVVKLLLTLGEEIETRNFKTSFTKLFEKVCKLIPRLAFDQASIESIGNKEKDIVGGSSDISILSMTESFLLTPKKPLPYMAADNLITPTYDTSSFSVNNNAASIRIESLMELKDMVCKAAASEDLANYLTEISKKVESMIEDVKLNKRM
jgi:hypothetical protein